MRLLFISNLFPDTAERYRGQDNAEVLRRLVARGYEVRVISPRPVLWPKRRGSQWADRTARPDEAAMAPVYPLYRYLPKIGGLANHLFLRAALRPVVAEVMATFRPEVVLCSWAFPDTVAAAPLLRAAEVPFVGLVQGTDVHGYLASARRRRLIVGALTLAETVICRSGDLGRRLAEAGVPADRLRTVYNGVDMAVFHPEEVAAARQSLGWTGPGPWLLYVGNFYTVKNPGLAVEALRRLRQQPAAANARLVMVGGGPLEDAVRAQATAAGLGDAVVLAGRKTAVEVATHLQAADALVISSHNEGLPNVLLEALACGCPVVSTRVGGIAEVLREGEVGHLVPPNDAPALADALTRLLATPPARADVATLGATFTWDRAVSAYEETLAAARDRAQPRR